MTCQEILDRLRFLAKPASVAGMARYGINPEGTLGISIPTLRKTARESGKRNPRLNALAIETAREIQALDSRAARWIASDALRGLTGEKVRRRLDVP